VLGSLFVTMAVKKHSYLVQEYVTY